MWRGGNIHRQYVLRVRRPTNTGLRTVLSGRGHLAWIHADATIAEANGGGATEAPHHLSLADTLAGEFMLAGTNFAFDVGFHEDLYNSPHDLAEEIMITRFGQKLVEWLADLDHRVLSGLREVSQLPLSSPIQ